MSDSEQYSSEESEHSEDDSSCTSSILAKRKDVYSSEYWKEAAKNAHMKAQAARLQLSSGKLANHPGIFWSDEEKTKDIFTNMKAAEKEKEIFEDQARRLNPQENNLGPKREGFVDLVARGHLVYKNEIRQLEAKIHQLRFKVRRLKSQIGKGQYDRRSNDVPLLVDPEFKEACVAKFNAECPRNDWHGIWCPVERSWLRKSSTIAMHLFAYWHGQNTMDTIFGQAEEPELFSPLNSLLVSRVVGQYIRLGYIGIVPDVPNEPSADDIEAWNNSNPKEYKIRILDSDWHGASNIIDPYGEKRWGDLDGQRVEFKSSFRPRAKYLYFLYVTQMLQLAWTYKKLGKTKSKKELKFWSVPGPYLPKTMLLALVEEMGQEYDHLLEGAVQGPEEDNEKNLEAKETEMAIGLLTVLRQVKKPEAAEDSEDECVEDHEW